MRKRLVLTFLAAALAVCAPRAARADLIAFTTGGGATYLISGYTIGYTFTLASSVSVTQLGFYDYQADGLAAAMPVTIWDGNRTALATATVPAGTSAGEINQYLYVRLATPVTLPAGAYTIGAYVTNNNDAIQRYLSTITPAAGISYGAPRLIYANAYPTGTGDFGAYFGPNFQIVPEPSTWALLAVGIGALGLVLRRRAARA